MATYRLYYPQDPLFGSSLGFEGEICKMKNDAVARVTAREMMQRNGWRYIILERKYRDTFRIVAKYNNPMYYVGCSPWEGGWYVYNCKETKSFGEGLKSLENATAYAKQRNRELTL